MATTSSFLSGEYKGTDTSFKYFSKSVSDINSVINNAVPHNAVITSVKVNVNVSFSFSGLGTCKAVYAYGFGSSGGISNSLLGRTNIHDSTFGDKSGSKSHTTDITSKMSSLNYPFAISTSYGSYFTVALRSENVQSKTLKVDSVTLDITYEIPTYKITTSVTPTGGGTVTGGGTYDRNSRVTLKATPATGYKFVKWSDGNTSATRTITVTEAKTYTAEFEKITYKISTAVSPTGAGTVTGGGAYEPGKTATLTAKANSGYIFKRWSDGVTSATRTITVTGAATYTAEFVKGYSVVFTDKSNWEGKGVITGATEGEYAEGTVLTLTAVANDGFKFTKWGVINLTTGGGLSQPTDNPLKITVTGQLNIYPVFAANPPEFLSTQLLYSNKQVSQSNKVKAGEGFRIIIDVQ